MSLSLQQKKLIVDVDNKTKSILKNGGNEETLLVEMLDFMPAIKEVITSNSQKELDVLTQEYDGFYAYMKILEKLAQKIADGNMTVS